MNMTPVRNPVRLAPSRYVANSADLKSLTS